MGEFTKAIYLNTKIFLKSVLSMQEKELKLSSSQSGSLANSHLPGHFLIGPQVQS